jgi:hypothetical protein
MHEETQSLFVHRPDEVVQPSNEALPPPTKGTTPHKP